MDILEGGGVWGGGREIAGGAVRSRGFKVRQLVLRGEREHRGRGWYKNVSKNRENATTVQLLKLLYLADLLRDRRGGGGFKPR